MPTIHDLPLVAGHPALDLVNTVDRGGPDPVDHLREPADLLVLATRLGLLEPGEVTAADAAWEQAPQLGSRCLAAYVELRGALHAVVTDGRGLPGAQPGAAEAGAATVRRLWAEAATRAELRPRPGGPGLADLVFGEEPGLRPADRMAAAAMDLLLTANPARVRQCPPAEGGCGWLFLDQTRNGSRRWCLMADCGNQVKSRRLTERRRAARSGGRADA